MERASQVCSTCKARKKACDKILPSCGYCSRRGLTCDYGSPRTNAGTGIAVGSVADLLSCTEQANLDGLINLQLCHVIHVSGLQPVEIARRFFRSFHQWLPIISTTGFRDTSSRFGRGVPPADFSLLLLCMYLMTLQPGGEFRTSQSQMVRPSDLYFAAKLFLSHIQAVTCSSVALVQASILIAIYEYACGMANAAFVTAGGAARLASILGLHKAASDPCEAQCYSELAEQERRNVWWGIVVLERQDEHISARVPCDV